MTALNHARRDQLTWRLGDPRGQARGAEEHDPGEEQPLAAEQVAEAAGGDQRSGESEHVGGHHPLQLSGTGAKVVTDRGQRDVHDRHVDHVHQHRDHHRHGGEPAARVAVRGCGRMGRGRRDRAHGNLR